MRQKLKNFKTIGDLAQAVGLSERELWAVITGETTRDFGAAEKLSAVSGISVMTLMHIQSSRIRPGFLAWLSALTKLSKTEIWHVFQGERPVDSGKARALEAVTGISENDWKAGTAWMIRAKGKDNADPAENAARQTCPAMS